MSSFWKQQQYSNSKMNRKYTADIWMNKLLLLHLFTFCLILYLINFNLTKFEQAIWWIMCNFSCKWINKSWWIIFVNMHNSIDPVCSTCWFPIITSSSSSTQSNTRISTALLHSNDEFGQSFTFTCIGNVGKYGQLLYFHVLFYCIF